MGSASLHWFLGLAASSVGWPESQEHPEEWARPFVSGSLETWGAAGEESRSRRCCSSLAKGARARRPWESKRRRWGAVAAVVVVVAEEEGLEAPAPPVRGCWALGGALGTHRVGGEGAGAGWAAGAVGLVGASLLCH